MIKYYTRACNFYYGKLSKKLVKNKKALPLGGNKEISFDKIEIFFRNKKNISSKIIDIKKISSLHKKIKSKITADIKKIISTQKLNPKLLQILKKLSQRENF